MGKGKNKEALVILQSFKLPKKTSDKKIDIETLDIPHKLDRSEDSERSGKNGEKSPRSPRSSSPRISSPRVRMNLGFRKRSKSDNKLQENSKVFMDDDNDLSPSSSSPLTQSPSTSTSNLKRKIGRKKKEKQFTKQRSYGDSITQNNTIISPGQVTGELKIRSGSTPLVEKQKVQKKRKTSVHGLVSQKVSTFKSKSPGHKKKSQRINDKQARSLNDERLFAIMAAVKGSSSESLVKDENQRRETEEFLNGLEDPTVSSIEEVSTSSSTYGWDREFCSEKRRWMDEAKLDSFNFVDTFDVPIGYSPRMKNQDDDLVVSSEEDLSQLLGIPSSHFTSLNFAPTEFEFEVSEPSFSDTGENSTNSSPQTINEKPTRQGMESSVDWISDEWDGSNSSHNSPSPSPLLFSMSPEISHKSKELHSKKPILDTKVNFLDHPAPTPNDYQLEIPKPDNIAINTNTQQRESNSEEEITIEKVSRKREGRLDKTKKSSSEGRIKLHSEEVKPIPRRINLLKKTSTSHRFGGSEKCNSCGKPVYHMEKIIALGKTWHKACYRCASCDRILPIHSEYEIERKPYCKQHYNSLFLKSVR